MNPLQARKKRYDVLWFSRFLLYSSSQLLTSAISLLLGARSQINSFPRFVTGLYLYSAGSQRQVFSVLSHLGLSCSYTALVGSGTQSIPGKTGTSEKKQIMNHAASEKDKEVNALLDVGVDDKMDVDSDISVWHSLTL